MKKFAVSVLIIGFALLVLNFAAGCIRTSGTASGPIGAQPIDTPTPYPTVTTADGYEYDGNSTNATAVTDSTTSANHNHHNVCDEDWYAIYCVTTTDYHFDTTLLGTDSDTYMFVIDTDGVTVLEENDDYVGVAAGIHNFVPPVNGTYYVKVVHKLCQSGTASGSLSGSDTGYQMEFTTE